MHARSACTPPLETSLSLPLCLQNVFNALVRRAFSESGTHPSSERLFYGWGGRLVVGVLPVSMFASGHTFHVQHLHEVRLHKQPSATSATASLGNPALKRQVA
jgi:arabinosyltransferase